MRRTLTLLAAVLVSRAAPALAYPLDLNLDQLGQPTAGGSVTADQAAMSRLRFALLASELALALSSFTLEPPETLGYSGFAIDFEAAYAPVGFNTGGSGPATAAEYWPTHGQAPGHLFLPTLHVRKGLPWSFEIGGRVIYLNQSTMMAAQSEIRWAVHEALGVLPDMAVRAAITHLFDQRDLDLTTTDLDFTVGKKFAVGGFMTLTPYAAVRFTWMHASTGVIDFGADQHGWPAAPTPAELAATQAAFPEMSASDHHFVRFALGARLVTDALSLAAEATYFGGQSLSAGDYPAYDLKAALSAAFKVGLQF